MTSLNLGASSDEIISNIQNTTSNLVIEDERQSTVKHKEMHLECDKSLTISSAGYDLPSPNNKSSEKINYDARNTSEINFARKYEEASETREINYGRRFDERVNKPKNNIQLQQEREQEEEFLKYIQDDHSEILHNNIENESNKLSLIVEKNIEFYISPGKEYINNLNKLQVVNQQLKDSLNIYEVKYKEIINDFTNLQSVCKELESFYLETFNTIFKKGLIRLNSDPENKIFNKNYQIQILEILEANILSIDDQRKSISPTRERLTNTHKLEPESNISVINNSVIHNDQSTIIIKPMTKTIESRRTLNNTNSFKNNKRVNKHLQFQSYQQNSYRISPNKTAPKSFFQISNIIPKYDKSELQIQGTGFTIGNFEKISNKNTRNSFRKITSKSSLHVNNTNTMNSNDENSTQTEIIHSDIDKLLILNEEYTQQLVYYQHEFIEQEKKFKVKLNETKKEFEENYEIQYIPEMIPPEETYKIFVYCLKNLKSEGKNIYLKYLNKKDVCNFKDFVKILDRIKLPDSKKGVLDDSINEDEEGCKVNETGSTINFNKTSALYGKYRSMLNNIVNKK